MFNKSLFNNPLKDLNNCNVIFVSDAYSDTLNGGAELSTDALFETCPKEIKVSKVLASEVNIDLLQKFKDKFWVFFNISSMDWNLIPTIIANLDYIVVEYDYKYCKWRSPEKHKHIEGENCNCNNQLTGQLYSALILNSKTVFWMSEKQEKIYLDLFPELKKTNRLVLGSIFNEEFFIKIKDLRQKYYNKKNENWIILASSSWIKGADEAIKIANNLNLKYELVWGLSYDDMLEKLAQSKGLIFHPLGSDTCPRIVIEAKLLGCELNINENVQHAKEEWFDTENLTDIEEILYASPGVFWDSVFYYLNFVHEISGYTTTYNCNLAGYPWKESIQSMLNFCNEVIVVDGGSTDGTYEDLVDMSNTNNKIKLFLNPIDFSRKDWAVQSDGAQKAYARSKCTLDFCWQQDVDEILRESDSKKITNLCKSFPKAFDILDLPVVEYWGSKNKIRVDINPWKWRLSRNVNYITHGIPAELRRYREDGTVYSMPGSDSCDYINSITGVVVPHIGFYDENVHNVRVQALLGNEKALKIYEEWFQKVVDNLPTVIHYSWFDIERKLKMYKYHWSKFWTSLYGIEYQDTPEQNMVFEKSWSDVTEEDIKEMANLLSEKTGGHIFHKKFDPEKITPHIKLSL
jgi:glycosyltransferase involved in cell wall biosynthesis